MFTNMVIIMFSMVVVCIGPAPDKRVSEGSGLPDAKRHEAEPDSFPPPMRKPGGQLRWREGVIQDGVVSTSSLTSQPSASPKKWMPIPGDLHEDRPFHHLMPSAPSGTCAASCQTETDGGAGSLRLSDLRPLPQLRLRIDEMLLDEFTPPNLGLLETVSSLGRLVEHETPIEASPRHFDQQIGELLMEFDQTLLSMSCSIDAHASGNQAHSTASSSHDHDMGVRADFDNENLEPEAKRQRLGADGDGVDSGKGSRGENSEFSLSPE